MNNKALSSKSGAMKEIETYMGYNRKEDKEIINRNKSMIERIIAKKFKERGWERC